MWILTTFLLVTMLLLPLNADILYGIRPGSSHGRSRLRDSPTDMGSPINNMETLIGIRKVPVYRFVDVEETEDDDEVLYAPRQMMTTTQTSPTGFCSTYRSSYLRYCIGVLAERSESMVRELYQFCPRYENKCERSLRT